ncbi:MAG: DUF4230 domain-containing protein [Cytophagaceae bacterium]|nr:DUF4230 domain-containing protein [Cytophagaceae bacterium]
MKKLALFIFPWFALVVVCFVWVKQCTSSAKEDKEEIQVVNHHMVIEKIEAIGKLEVVKFYIKDIVEHSTQVEWWPDPKVVLIVNGEATGCIDLTKLDSSNVSIGADFISLNLPAPEICYFKINHEQSKIYNVDSKLLSEAPYIEKAYKAAEIQIKEAALKMNIIEQAKTNARNLLKPMLENFTGKKVNIEFKQ